MGGPFLDYGEFNTAEAPERYNLSGASIIYKELVETFPKSYFALSGDAVFASKSKRTCKIVLRLPLRCHSVFAQDEKFQLRRAEINRIIAETIEG